MALPPYEVNRDESKASTALTIAVGAIVLGILAFWFALQEYGMAIVVLGPMIGLAMLAAAGVCIYSLSKSKTAGGAIRTAVSILSGLLVLLGLVAVGFLAMGGGGIYK
jgi:hypothetical protein